MTEMQSTEIHNVMNAISSVHDKYSVVIEKDAKGHKGTYAKLDNILVEIHRRCKEFGLVLIQRKIIINAQEALESLLFHKESKQWMKAISLIHTNPNAQSPDQVWGGSDTYHRRYDAMGLLGLCSSDDPADHDGWKDHTEVAPKASVSQIMNIINSDNINEKQQGLLRAKLNGDKSLADKILSRWNIAKLSDIPRKEFNAVLAFIEQNK